MAQKSSDLGRFWQELRRRKVFKVVAMYAGTAFIILEVVNNLVGPLRLPEWTPTLVVVILGVGFPFAIIFSWIFDITPQGLKKTESIEVIRKKRVQTVPVKRGIKASDIIIAAMAIVIIILLYPKIFKRNTLEEIRLSGERIVVAVMPFQNMTNDTTKNFWQEMIQDNLVASLSNSEELQIRQTESINTLLQNNNLTNYASITPSVAGRISQKLDASVFVHGSINQVGSIIRMNAKLIDSETEEVFKSFQLDGTTENILNSIDSLSSMVNSFLILTSLKKVTSPELKNFVSTSSPEAYRSYIYGRNAFYKRDYTAAVDWLSQAIAIDSNFTFATVMICLAYSSQGMINQSRIHALSAYNKLDELPLQQKVIAKWLYAVYYETYHEENKYLIQYLEFDDQAPPLYDMLGRNYNGLYQYDRAIPEFEKALEIYDNWGIKPPWVENYTNLGLAYHKTGQYRKEKNLYKKAEQNFPDDPFLIYRQAIISLTEGDSVAANRYIQKYISLRKDRLESEAAIATNLAFIYSETDNLDKAEDYFREALTLEPGISLRINNLAFFLIDKDRNINEGMDLIEKAIELSPDNYLYLDTKGWGLYKQGKYTEALEILEKSWELKPVYNHKIFLHLDEARKAVRDNARI
jgi:tetratricopeptide (TPR) repeat protein/TolB-like protein